MATMGSMAATASGVIAGSATETIMVGAATVASTDAAVFGVFGVATLQALGWVALGTISGGTLLIVAGVGAAAGEEINSFENSYLEADLHGMNSDSLLGLNAIDNIL
jgi:hypothetical protein